MLPNPNGRYRKLREAEMPDAEVLTLKEAASYVRVSEKTLREKALAKQVPGQKIGREWRLLKKALDDYLSGLRPRDDGSGMVSESVGQLYLPATEKVRAPTKAGFGDTAFTKNRDEPVHRWVPWVAGFSSSFVGEILERELANNSQLTVLDPFAGVGTTLVEGVKRGCDVVGFEINPYAALACTVKLEAIRKSPRAVRDTAKRLVTTLRRQLRNGSREASSTPPSGFRTRDPFFSPKVEHQILLAKDFIRDEKQAWLRRLLNVALGSVMVGVSNYSYEPSLGRRVSAGKQPILDADLPGILQAQLLRMAQDIEIVQANGNGNRRSANGRVFKESCMTGATTRLDPGSVDVLITSPPYLNNYHYVRNTRPQIYWLDFAQEAADLQDLETTSFGKFWQTVRNEPEMPLDFSYPELEARLAELRALHPEKGAYGGAGWANYAVTYFNDCARFCQVTAKVMKPGGLVVVVIGNNILQGIEFKTDEFFAHIAEDAGFETVGLHQVRKKRTGSSIVNSSVRVGVTKKRTALYETAVELRRTTSS